MLKMIRQRTVAESQGCVKPPKSRARSSIMLLPIMNNEPIQSTALRPSQIGVCGLSSLRANHSNRNANPVIGTRVVVLISRILFHWR